MALFDDGLMEAALAELARTEEITTRMRTQGAAIACEAHDRNRLLSVTVGAQGDVRELRFRGEGYRDLAPAELADLLVRTIEQARQAAREKALAGMRELMVDLPSPIGRLGEVASVDELVEELADMFTRNQPDGGKPVAPPDGDGVWR
jgi:DNA-binding protein YbaB